ncbi:hypothetical protein [Oscillatoria sp. FACHB-1407]|uniref:hypothetical protein n=1 Tax=Oscillatoria sp. FACHB-1407 TaxID=2692847 RepID=UPI0018F0161D|nr:hypothetical protein [Oscillatoria sp. FACHB-1407]
MLSNVDLRLDTLSSVKDSPVSYSDSIIGAAIFDLSGLPKEYFTTAESNDVSWVQTIFQALGLQSLLISSLRLEGFRHAVVHGSGYRAIVVRQRARYTALLVRQSDQATISNEFIQWSLEFEPRTLRTHPRFSTI